MARILVIEDNTDNLELMSYLLRAFGHSVVTAEDGAEGLQAVCRELPELIVCDVHLPKLDGYEVAQQLKADPELKRIPLIAVTALAMVGDRDKGLAAGFDGYIDKPIDPEKFVGQVEHFLPAEQRGSVPLHRHTQTPYAAGNGSQSKHATVLVVDDSQINRELIRDTLDPYGYEVWLAHSVAQALSIARESTPDLILSDLHMPGEDGFNLISKIKADARLAAVPFIFISSSVWGEQDRAMALQLGVSRFLLRPIEPQMLLDEIAVCLLNQQGLNNADNPGR